VGFSCAMLIYQQLIGVQKRLFWSYLIFGTDSVISIITGVFLARILGPEQVGLMAATIAGFSLAQSLVEGGFSTFLTRAVAREPEKFKEYLLHTFFLRLIFTFPLLTVIACIFVLFAIIKDASAQIIFSGEIYLFAFILYGTFYAGYAGKEAFKSWWLMSTPLRLFVLFLGIAVAQITGRIESSYFSMGSLVILGLLLLNRPLGIKTEDIRLTTLKEVIRSGLAFAIWNVTSSISLKFDSFWLGVVRSSYEAGLYSSAYQLFLWMGSILGPIYVVAFPALSRLARKSSSTFQRATWMLLGFSVILGISLSLLLFFSGEKAVPFLFGNKFNEAGPMARLLGLSLLPLSLNRMAGNILNARGMEWWVASAGLVSCVVNVVLNIVYIPIHGPIAAVYTNLVSECIHAVILLILMYKCRVFVR
jgi:O-antigen/teichoic acid export membrane protein